MIDVKIISVQPAFDSPCRPDPAQRDLLVEIRDNLVTRIIEAKRDGRPGEVEGLQTGRHHAGRPRRVFRPRATGQPEPACGLGRPEDPRVGPGLRERPGRYREWRRRARPDRRRPGGRPTAGAASHVPFYRTGTVFGRSWASTLDQRLEVNACGVVFVAEDRMILVYPQPPVSGEVPPEVGPRWPPTRNGAGYTVRRRDNGRSLHFDSPRPWCRSPPPPTAQWQSHRPAAGERSRSATAAVTTSMSPPRADASPNCGCATRTGGDPTTLVRYGCDDIGDLNRVRLRVILRPVRCLSHRPSKANARDPL